MGFFTQFQEPIKSSGEPIDTTNKNLMAYRMDGENKIPDMRKSAGLGTCHCCDFFFLKDENIILIEETRLFCTVEKLAKDFQEGGVGDKLKFIERSIKSENVLKVYGAMLVLSRLEARMDDVKKILSGKAYVFWLVVSGKSGDERFLANVETGILPVLRGLFSKKIMQGVKVFPIKKLPVLYGC